MLLVLLMVTDTYLVDLLGVAGPVDGDGDDVFVWQHHLQLHMGRRCVLLEKLQIHRKYTNNPSL